jgi:hypothetical protein
MSMEGVVLELAQPHNEGGCARTQKIIETGGTVRIVEDRDYNGVQRAGQLDEDYEGPTPPLGGFTDVQLSGRKKPGWIYELPHLIYRIYEETHSALCNEELILAGIGIRAIVEAVCTHRGLTSGNLQSKINDLESTGAVTADGAKILHSLRFMGNAAAHETKAHTPPELGTGFEVVENILFNSLILPLRVTKLPTK